MQLMLLIKISLRPYLQKSELKLKMTKDYFEEILEKKCIPLYNL